MTGRTGPRSGSRAGAWVLWGSELSPFALKVELLLRFAGVPFRWLPASGGFRDALRTARRRARVVRGRLPLHWPPMSELDEFPQVPFLFGPGGENLYDSSAIAAWLATGAGPAPRDCSSLLPADRSALGFAVRLVDEAMDELGLYLAHHNRWVVSARDNDAGARLAREMRPLLGPLAAPFGRRLFPARQVRRLPYLFSVADPASRAFDDLPGRLRPPARPGFPPTHALLDELFEGLLDAVEPILASRPFLFGEAFTLADASLYGQLGMNRSDPSAWMRIRRRAPATASWIGRLAKGVVGEARGTGALRLDEALEPLLRWVGTGFMPLMVQNERAWERHRRAGETRFNERAFDAGRALYDGELRGRPFRSVVKTFQVRVWRDLRAAWRALPEPERERLGSLLPPARELLDETTSGCAGG